MVRTADFALLGSGPAWLFARAAVYAPLVGLALATGCAPISPARAFRDGSRHATPRQALLTACDRGDLAACERSAYVHAYGHAPNEHELAAVRPRDVCAEASSPDCQDAQRTLAQVVGTDAATTPPARPNEAQDATELSVAKEADGAKSDLRARAASPATKPERR